MSVSQQTANINDEEINGIAQLPQHCKINENCCNWHLAFDYLGPILYNG